ncbi:DUF4815 domain-containing protein [Diaphorobacter sp. HDW4A]|uniref:DUF4815 domain-containing protein n=1 Tax=Diaphorobacter sp. HDW4A TaxID=2714924 RepID=UPI00140C9380|nr:DUF4815 domain-containing protein [Diaphorobacter sp. HDW4A]QIL80817.1 DUF4815 domain-containing protein [Diaphorobacter sp. HDW4A]
MTIYNGFDAAKGYTKVLVHADRVAGSAEQNEAQSIIDHRITRIADVLFADGDITEGARCTVNAETGECSMEAGGIYISGAVHDLAAASLQVPVVGLVYVGVLYRERVVTAVDDPTLYNRAAGAAGYGELGADRLQVSTAWGVQGDGQPGNFYPVWTIRDGVVTPREPAPTMNATTQAIERYDRDSTGGSYVVRGLVTIQSDDDEQGRQVFAVTAGAARISGRAVEQPVDRRVVFAAVPDVELISGEPHNVDTAGLLHVQFDRWPVLQPAKVKIPRNRVAQISHGPFLGAADPLPENSVYKINSVKQGGTTYQKDVDYKLTAGQVDWSPDGAEVVPGSEYTVDFDYISTEDVLNQTPRGFDVQGGVPQTVLQVDYAYAMKRIDRIVMNGAGELDIIKGIPATWQPVDPDVPGGVLALASVVQTWDADTRRTVADAVRTVQMDTLVSYATRMDDIELDLAELRLATDVAGRYSGLKKGYFADPMMDNTMRDQGREQTAMVSGQALQLYEFEGAFLMGDGVTAYGLAYDFVAAVSQLSFSRAMAINPSGAAGQLPATIALQPAVDRWEAPYPQAYPLAIDRNASRYTIQSAFDELYDKSTIDVSNVHMRQIEVTFSLSGFRPLEPLASVAFDGVPVAVTPVAGGSLIANARGEVYGAFTVPANISIGMKAVEFVGENGSKGSANYLGGAVLTLKTYGRWSTMYGGYGAGSGVVTYVI